REIQALECAARDDDFIDRDRRAVRQVALCDLPPQLLIARRQTLDRAPRVHVSSAAAEMPCELGPREEHRTREGGTERNGCVLSRGFEDLEDELVDIDASASARRPRVPGLAMGPLPACTDVVTRAWTAFDEAFGLERFVRAHRRRRTHFSFATQCPNGRHAIARPQRALADQVRELGCKLAIACHALVRL